MNDECPGNNPDVSYSLDDHAQLAAALGIEETDRVLDVGAGHAPFDFADVIVDIDFHSGQHRDGQKIPLDFRRHSYIQADIHHLPFIDKSFDMVICTQVLEHVAEPAAACEELMRVGRKGFIEVPRKWTEFYAGYPSHRWLVDEQDGVLCFEPIRFEKSPFLNFMLPPLWGSPDLLENVTVKYRGVPCIQLLWKDRFQFRVLGEEVGGRTITDTALAERHYHFGRNLLYWMAAPAHGIYHAKRAVELDSANRDYQRLLSIYLLLEGKWKEGMRNRIGLRFFFHGFLLLFIIHVYRWLRSVYLRIVVVLSG